MNKKTIGIIGGGQLCLMMGEAIKDKNLPYKLIAIDPTPNCPAQHVIDTQIVGSYKDETTIKRLADSSDIVTFEIELANSHVLTELQARGMPVHPSPQTLKIIQDKYTQAAFLRNNNIPVPNFQRVTHKADLEKAISDYGLPLMIKARTDSYDGNGNYVVRDPSEIPKVFSYFSQRAIMAQQYIPFDSEVSVISARGMNGEIATFPVGENIHGADYNILETTIVPARVSNEVLSKAQEVAKATMNALKGAGVFGIEMFVAGSDVIINEIAPRVHNSGHYSIEACQTSQFEQHIRAVAGDQLGATGLVSDYAVMHNIIGPQGYTGKCNLMCEGTAIIGTTQIMEGVVVHNYGKHFTKPYRKMGHLTVISHKGETQDEVLLRSEQIRNKITIEPVSE